MGLTGTRAHGQLEVSHKCIPLNPTLLARIVTIRYSIARSRHTLQSPMDALPDRSASRGNGGGPEMPGRTLARPLLRCNHVNLADNRLLTVGRVTAEARFRPSCNSQRATGGTFDKRLRSKARTHLLRPGPACTWLLPERQNGRGFFFFFPPPLEYQET